MVPFKVFLSHSFISVDSFWKSAPVPSPRRTWTGMWSRDKSDYSLSQAALDCPKGKCFHCGSWRIVSALASPCSIKGPVLVKWSVLEIWLAITIDGGSVTYSTMLVLGFFFFFLSLPIMLCNNYFFSGHLKYCSGNEGFFRPSTAIQKLKPKMRSTMKRILDFCGLLIFLNYSWPMLARRRSNTKELFPFMSLHISWKETSLATLAKLFLFSPRPW